MGETPKTVPRDDGRRSKPGSKAKPAENVAANLDRQIEDAVGALSALRKRPVLPLFHSQTDITNNTVDDVYDLMRVTYGHASEGKCKALDVVLESGGGNIDAAYNVGLLLRRYATDELTIIVPRWAKSAATVLACSGDTILMTPIAELGPVDPQITMVNPLENRAEAFSPIHIESTLELIRNEFREGHASLAQGLLERLQFPLTLGSIKKSLDVGTDYITKLLLTRMLKGKDDSMVRGIAKRLVQDYATHAFCIEVDEAKLLGLNTRLLSNDEADAVWLIRKLVRQKEAQNRAKKQQELQDLLKGLPPEIQKLLPSSTRDADDHDGRRTEEAL